MGKRGAAGLKVLSSATEHLDSAALAPTAAVGICGHVEVTGIMYVADRLAMADMILARVAWLCPFCAISWSLVLFVTQ